MRAGARAMKSPKHGPAQRPNPAPHPGPRPSPAQRPSEVRVLMLTECDSLRTLLAEIGTTARREPQRLPAGIVELRDRLRDYRAREETLLRPALAATDHAGPARLTRIQAAHAPRIVAVEELAARAQRSDADPRELALRVVVLRSELERDLDEDERCLLLPEVLQDDVCHCDQTDG